MATAQGLRAGDWGKGIRLASRLHHKGDLKGAEEQLLKTLFIAESFGDKDPRLAYTLDYLGTLNMQMGQPSKAEPMFARALKVFEAAKGEKSEEALASCANLADSYEARNQWDKALPFYQRLVDAKRGDEVQQAADLNNLALALDALGKQDLAMDRYEQALNLRLAKFGPESTEVAEILSNQARVWYMKGDSAKSEELFLKALAIDEKLLGPKDPQVAEDCLRLAPLYRKLGRDVEALKLEERAEGIKDSEGEGVPAPQKKKAKP